MSDVAVAVSGTKTSATPAFVFRPAQIKELKLVHRRLMEAIDTSPFYSQEFKAYERARLSPEYLLALHDADPHHVLLFIREDVPAGFMISGPELGTLWLYWSYVFPEFRRSTLALYGMRNFINHWDNGRFHKIATYTKTGNDPAAAVMRRLGFRQVATLEQHIFGEDYLLYERALTKQEPGYDRGTKGGFKNRLARKLRLALFG
ncbi:GNAT family N-acetyltransferase [Devosia albogilva]|uniref:GNAT family N-acetyltransferase n=1 Tax=Devosia albogilva TaxID=429726 RepID=A0ABW5QG73_9HYPH